MLPVRPPVPGGAITDLELLGDGRLTLSVASPGGPGDRQAWMLDPVSALQERVGSATREDNPPVGAGAAAATPPGAPRSVLRRRKLLALAGAGTLVLVVGGVIERAADQGVFSTNTGPAYDAWRAWDLPGGENLDLVRAAVGGCATPRPSPRQRSHSNGSDPQLGSHPVRPVSPFGICASSIADDDLDAGVCAQPVGEHLGCAVVEQINGPMGFQVKQQRPVPPLFPSQRDVINAQHPRAALSIFVR